MLVEQVFPIFEEGRILKRDTLDMLRDYAPEYFSLLTRNYGSGILAGFRIEGSQEEIVVEPGILKDGDSCFIMKHIARLTCDTYGETVQVLLKSKGMRTLPDYRICSYDLTIEKVSESEKGVYELGRFRLEKGAKLRAGRDYKDIYDVTTEFNTLNTVHVKYACENGSSLSPFILKMFATGILTSPKLDPLDASFAVTCLNSPRVSAGLIKQYLSIKCGRKDPGEDNYQWYKRLLEVYSQLVLGNDVRKPVGRASAKTMID